MSNQYLPVPSPKALKTKFFKSTLLSESVQYTFPSDATTTLLNNLGFLPSITVSGSINFSTSPATELLKS